MGADAEEGTKGAAWALEMGSLAEVWASEGRGKALLLTVRVASEALAQAGAEDDDQVAEPLEMFGQKLQLTAAALLATVPDREAVIATRNGRDAVAAAVRGGCKFFVARPAVQAALYDEWVGAAAGEQKANWVSYLVAPFIVVLNVVVFLPLVALLPPLDDVLVRPPRRQPARARRRASPPPSPLSTPTALARSSSANCRRRSTRSARTRRQAGERGERGAPPARRLRPRPLT